MSLNEFNLIAAVDPDARLDVVVKTLSELLLPLGPDSKIEARRLVAAASGLDPAGLILYGDRKLGQEAALKLKDWVARRLHREPLSRILGTKGFWEHEFQLAPDVLDPRPDSETIIRVALDLLPHRRAEPIRILDLGTGSGALLCSLLGEFPAASGIGVDVSVKACALAQANLDALGFQDRGQIVQGDWAACIGQKFDLIVSNPPYIASAVIETLAPEVLNHDPRLALDGGADGLEAYRQISQCLADQLKPEAIALFEIGYDQGASVTGLFSSRSYPVLGVWRDYGGHERVVGVKNRRLYLLHTTQRLT